MTFEFFTTKFQHATWKQTQPVTFCYCVDNFIPWKDIIGKKVSKLRLIAELRAFYGRYFASVNVTLQYFLMLEIAYLKRVCKGICRLSKSIHRLKLQFATYCQVPDRGRGLLCENVPTIAVTEHAKESPRPPPPPREERTVAGQVVIVFPSLGVDSLLDFPPLTHTTGRQ